MKNSQLYGQMFTYILTIVLVAVILLYGYKTVQEFRSRAEQAYCLKLRNDLSGSIESLMGDFGSVKRKDIELCAGYTQACFVETFDFKNVPKGNPISNVPLDPIIKDSIRSEIDKNTFLAGKSGRESFYSGNISINSGSHTLDVLCINAVNNKISLRLEGIGDHVIVSQWS